MLSNRDYLLLIYTFMCMIIVLRIMILSFQSRRIRILSAVLGMARNRDGLSWFEGFKSFILRPSRRKQSQSSKIIKTNKKGIVYSLSYLKGGGVNILSFEWNRSLCNKYASTAYASTHWLTYLSQNALRKLTIATDPKTPGFY